MEENYYVVGKDYEFWSVRTDSGKYPSDVTQAVKFYDLETAEDWVRNKDLEIYEVNTKVRRVKL